MRDFVYIVHDVDSPLMKTVSSILLLSALFLFGCQHPTEVQVKQDTQPDPVQVTPVPVDTLTAYQNPIDSTAITPEDQQKYFAFMLVTATQFDAGGIVASSTVSNVRFLDTSRAFRFGGKTLGYWGINIGPLLTSPLTINGHSMLQIPHRIREGIASAFFGWEYYWLEGGKGGSRDKRLCSLSIAVLLPIAILFRRWYAYWVVGFYVASFVEQSCFLFLKSTFRLKDYGKVLLWIAVQVAVSGVFLMAVAPIFVTKSMTTSYADVFSVYRYSHSVIEAFTRVVDQFGLLAFLLFTAGLIQGVLNKETRQFSIFVLIQWLVVFFLFSRTQDFGFGPHHTYLLLSAMLLFSAMFVTRLVTKGSILATSSVAVLLILNCLAAFSSAELWHKKPLTYLLTGIRHLPLVRTDLSEIDRMLKVLSNTLTDTNDRVYVLASSDVLNSSILSSAYLTFHRYADLSKRIFWTHSMDKFEGFPQELLTARYVIVTDPIQYHLRPGDQRVVGIPAELIVTGKNIGTSFVKLPYEFFLDGGVKCYLYKKIKEFDRSDLTMLSQMFRNYYPDRPNIYHIGGI